MGNELANYAKAKVAAAKADRATTAKARAIYDETRLAALMAQGTMALAEEMMQGITELHAQRQGLAQGDPILDAILVRLEVNAVRRLQKIQADLYSPWEL